MKRPVFSQKLSSVQCVPVSKLLYHFEGSKIYLTDGRVFIPYEAARQSCRYKGHKLSLQHNLNCMMQHIRKNFTVITITTEYGERTYQFGN